MNVSEKSDPVTKKSLLKRATCAGISGVVFLFFFQMPALAAAQIQASSAGLHGPEKQLGSSMRTIWWGGRVQLRGSVSWPGGKSYLQPDESAAMYDGRNVWRLKGHLFFSDWANMELHYELACSGGDMQESFHSLGVTAVPGLFGDPALFGLAPPDQHRLMDLTAVITEEDQWTIWHRLDRLCLTFHSRWGRLSLGRQSVSWGNGFLFNPLDIVSPFSPVDIYREYKMGEDMIGAQVPAGKVGTFQCVCVPRRNPVKDEVEWDQSSIAGKMHVISANLEYDILLAKHYRDIVVGLGGTGYLGDAAWRLDATWTILNTDQTRKGYAAMVANLDYSWRWGDRNWYGYVELFLNDLGTSSYPRAWANPDLSKRLMRAELFTIGRAYLSGQIRTEVHPLLNLFLTVINNCHDPSGIVQPRLVWDVTQNAQVVSGGNVMYGKRGSEFGGFEGPLSGKSWRLPDGLYLLLQYYF